MIKDSEWLGNSFTWFFGFVEATDDPLRLGRVRVRCFGWHTPDRRVLPVEDLPWAQVMMPPTSASVSQVGESPTGLMSGSFVFGFFTDGNLAQFPIVLGSLHGIPTESIHSSIPYPLTEYLGEPDVNRLARNDQYLEPENPNSKSLAPTLPTIKNNGRTTGVSIANSSQKWEEPVSAYNAQYPKNHVTQTESGHVFEIDDTTDNERIHEYHRSGSFYEIDADGNKVTRVVGNNYVIVAGSDYVNVKGSVNLTINGDCNMHIRGDWNVQVDGAKTETVTGKTTINNNGRTTVSQLITGTITRAIDANQADDN